MKPTETLKHEHQIILMVLEATEREARSMQGGARVREKEVAKMLDFFRNFTDRCHHAKEEKHLFPKMQERGLPRGGGPIAVMLHEHDTGRQKVKAVAEALPRAVQGDARSAASVQDNLLAYVELLRLHIEKENTVLFPMADRILSAEDQRALEAAFEKVEAEELGEGVHEKYHALAHELAEPAAGGKP